jgi:hypothetical protein
MYLSYAIHCILLNCAAAHAQLAVHAVEPAIREVVFVVKSIARILYISQTYKIPLDVLISSEVG